MPNIHIIGNCQVKTIALLTEKMVLNSTVQSLDITSRLAQHESEHHAFRSGLKQADYILIQPNPLFPLDIQSIKQEFPDKTFVIANLYFRGLHPDSCYVGSRADRFQNPSPYHSLVVLDAFHNGLSLKRALAAFNHENFHRLGLFDAWETNLEEIRRRDRLTDWPAASLIDGYCREFSGFLTMNHPTLGLVHHYLKGVFDRLGLPVRVIDTGAMHDPLTEDDITPVYDDIAEHHALPYRTTQRWKLDLLGRRFIDRAEYVERLYASYKKADHQRLHVHSPFDLVHQLKRDSRLCHLAFTE